VEEVSDIQVSHDCEGVKKGYCCHEERGFKLAVQDAVRESTSVCVREAIEESMNRHVHDSHHVYVDTMIERNKREQERWEKIKSQVLGWGIIAIAGWIGKLVLDALTHYRGQP